MCPWWSVCKFRVSFGSFCILLPLLYYELCTKKTKLWTLSSFLDLASGQNRMQTADILESIFHNDFFFKTFSNLRRFLARWSSVCMVLFCFIEGFMKITTFLHKCCLCVGVCHWIRAWRAPGTRWNRDSDVSKANRVPATRGYQKGRCTFWGQTRHGTLHGLWRVLLGRRGWRETRAWKPKVSKNFVFKVIHIHYTLRINYQSQNILVIIGTQLAVSLILRLRKYRTSELPLSLPVPVIAPVSLKPFVVNPL